MTIKPNVIVAHYKEALKWTDDIDRERYNVLIFSKTKREDVEMFQAENKGCEASAYLEYIVKYYDSLPEWSVFVHGHEFSKHHDGKLQDLVNKLEFKAPYFNFNKGSWPWNNYRINGVNMKESNAYPVLREVIPTLFSPLKSKFDFDHRTWRGKMCAQFYVHRDLIKRHSLDDYKTLLNNLYTYTHPKHNDKHKAIYFEWLWFFIFTGEYDEKDYYIRHGLPA